MNIAEAESKEFTVPEKEPPVVILSSRQRQVLAPQGDITFLGNTYGVRDELQGRQSRLDFQPRWFNWVRSKDQGENSVTGLHTAPLAATGSSGRSSSARVAVIVGRDRSVP